MFAHRLGLVENSFELIVLRFCVSGKRVLREKLVHFIVQGTA